MSLGVQSDPLPSTELGEGEERQLQCQTEQKFMAKKRHVYSSIVGLIAIWTMFTWIKSCSILYVKV